MRVVSHGQYIERGDRRQFDMYYSNFQHDDITILKINVWTDSR